MIIEGPTRTGKTVWARSLGRHNYFCGSINFSAYDSHALYNIVDDIPFQFLCYRKELLGAQKDFHVNEKYMRKKKVPGGIPCIVLCNPDQSYKLAIERDRTGFSDWALGNVIHLEIKEPFY